MPLEHTDEAVLATALRRIREWEQPIIIEADIGQVVGLIGMAQLALRHPLAKTTPTAKTVEKFVASLIEQIDPEHGELWTVLNRGFNPNFDV